MYPVLPMLLACSSPQAPSPVADVADAAVVNTASTAAATNTATPDDEPEPEPEPEPEVVEHRCLPMVEGGERKLPDVSTVEVVPLSFTALTCPNPWAPSATYFLQIDEAHGWSLPIIDPKRDWSGFILAKPSFGPMEIQTDRLADGVALTLRREDLSWGTGSQEVHVLDSDGQALGAPLRTSLGRVRVEDGALLATNAGARPLPYQVGALQRTWRYSEGTWAEVLPAEPWTVFDTWPCDAVAIDVLDEDGEPTGETVNIERGDRLEVQGFKRFGAPPNKEPVGIWSITINEAAYWMANPSQRCVG